MLPAGMAPDSPESRLTRVEVELANHRDQVRAFAPAILDIHELRVLLEGQAHDLDDFKRWLGDVERRIGERITAERAELIQRIDGCSTAIGSVRRDLRTYDAQRADARVKIILAVIAGSATVLAAVGAAVIAILGANP